MTQAPGRSNVPIQAYAFTTERGIIAREIYDAEIYLEAKRAQLAELDRVQGLTTVAIDSYGALEGEG